jgi:cyclopropane-fatty-acyl-phospholipid synthase
VSSGLYRGLVMHDRLAPRRHRFRYRVSFAAVDLDEAPELDRRLRLFSYNRPGLFVLRDEDHVGDADLGLRETVIELMAEEGVPRASRVVMVGNLRTAGYVFNPITLFYCYAGEELTGVLAEVSNTFGERVAYRLPVSEARPQGSTLTFERAKRLHVSPFFGMDQDYSFRLTEPGDRFAAVIDVHEEGARVFRGAWSGVRGPLSDGNLARHALRHPLSSQMVTVGIHAQAARLFAKGVAVHRKPPFEPGVGSQPQTTQEEPEPLSPIPPPRRSPLTPMARRIFMRMLRRPERGRVALRTPDGRVSRHGDPGSTPAVTVTIASPALFDRLARRGRVGLGEAYVAGDWYADDLPGALEILARTSHRARGAGGRLTERARALRPRRMRTTTRESARRDISYHYDLGNRLYELFLDETMTYSCAYFTHEGQSLAEAQQAKNRRLMDALGIGAEDHVLEIGCGWGGFAVQAATERGARVTGITLSVEQQRLARERIAEAGLDDLVDIRLVDFRDVQGSYSAIVSIEMLEAVGHKLLGPYFRACDRLLAPGGRAGIQVISIPDQRYEAYRKGNDWIREYIFPGGLLPSMGALTEAMRRNSRLTIRHVDDIGPHYATTLRLWRERFMANRDEAARRGYGEHFARTWEYYLAFCEAGFRVGALLDYQLVLTRPMEDTPQVRTFG